MLKVILDSLGIMNNFGAIVFFLCLSHKVIAGAVTDGSTGPIRSLSGAMLITESLGKKVSDNLFHSFTSFNINSGESATFTTITPTLANVISRVTGNKPSNLSGALTLNATGNPAFFFINPAGVTFGEGASIDIPGAFHVSTSDSLKFADGATVETDLSRTSTFTSAAPEAFGFIGNNALIKLSASTRLSNSDQPISITAGDIDINGTVNNTTGDIQLVAVGNHTGELIPGQFFSGAKGLMRIIDGSIGTEGNWPDKGGNILISAGSLIVDNSTIRTRSGYFEDADAGDLLVSVTDNINIHDGGIGSTTYSGGKSGNVEVKAESIVLKASDFFMRSSIYSDAIDGQGDAGSVSVAAENSLELLGGADIYSNTSSDGNSGDVSVKAGSILLYASISDSHSSISSESFGQGDAGSISITADNSIEVLGNARITSDTFFDGQAGEVNVHAGSIVLDGQTFGILTGISSRTNFGQGNAGSVSVTAENSLEVLGIAKISSGTLSDGKGGSVDVSAKQISIDGYGSINARAYSDS